MVWGQSLFGQLVMAAGVKIAVTVMAMLSVLILSQLVLSVREMTSPGIWKYVLLHSLQRIAVETGLKNKL